MSSLIESDYEEEVMPLLSSLSSHAVVRDNRTPYQKRLAVYLILASVLFETIAFYTVVTNLIVSMTPNTPRNWEPTHVLIASFIFTGASYCSTLIFAVVSDAKFGRVKTILLGFALYSIGYVSAAIITHPTTTRSICIRENDTNSSLTTPIYREPCVLWILSTLIVIAIGAGAVQSNMAALGAVQIQEAKIKSRYFDKYLVAINTGALIARLVSSFIKDDQTYFMACALAVIALLIATLLFISGRRYYIDAKPYDSVIMICIPVVINAYQTRSKYKTHTHSTVMEDTNSASSNAVNNIRDHTAEGVLIRADNFTPAFLDFAKVPNGGKFHERIVDDVKSLRNAFIVFSFLIPYFITYNQIYSGFPLQGQRMNWQHKDQHMVIWMSLSEPITVIVGIFILNIFVYKCLETRNRSVSTGKKLTLGMLFACISMCLAGSVEVVRENQCPSNPTTANGSSNLTIFAQLPQNVALGFSEMLAVVGSYEFAFYAAPRSAQSLFMSLRFCSLGTASFIGAVYVAAFSANSTIITLNFSCSQLSDRKSIVLNYFYSCAGLQLIFLVLFIVYQKKRRTTASNR